MFRIFWTRLSLDCSSMRSPKINKLHTVLACNGVKVPNPLVNQERYGISITFPSQSVIQGYAIMIQVNVIAHPTQV